MLNYLDKQLSLKAKEYRKKAKAATAQQCWNYASRQVVIPNFDRKDVWRDFQDYRRECHELGYDLTDEGVMFPRDMYSAHSRTSELVRKKREREQKKRTAEQARVWKEQAAERERVRLEREREQAEKYIKVIKAFLKKEFASNDFVLRVAKTAEEIIAEGRALRHCVGGYVDRVTSKSCLIFFVRSSVNPDKPLYTLELNYKTKKVVQCRGFGNASAPPEVYKFIEDALTQLNIKAAS